MDIDFIFNEALNFTLKFESRYYLSASKINLSNLEESYKGISRLDNFNNDIWSIIDENKKKLAISNNFDIQNNTVNDYFLNNKFRWTDLYTLLNNNKELEFLIYNFYKNNYWDILNILELNDQIHKKFFDLFVSLYIANTSKLIQKTINQIYSTDYEINNNILDKNIEINNKYIKKLKEISDSYIKTDGFIKILCENQRNVYIKFCEKHHIHKSNLNNLFIERSQYMG
jgi:hypothetical protein